MLCSAGRVLGSGAGVSAPWQRPAPRQLQRLRDVLVVAEAAAARCEARAADVPKLRAAVRAASIAAGATEAVNATGTASVPNVGRRGNMPAVTAQLSLQRPTGELRAQLSPRPASCAAPLAAAALPAKRKAALGAAVAVPCDQHGAAVAGPPVKRGRLSSGTVATPAPGPSAAAGAADRGGPARGVAGTAAAVVHAASAEGSACLRRTGGSRGRGGRRGRGHSGQPGRGDASSSQHDSKHPGLVVEAANAQAAERVAAVAAAASERLTLPLRPAAAGSSPRRLPLRQLAVNDRTPLAAGLSPEPRKGVPRCARQPAQQGVGWRGDGASPTPPPLSFLARVRGAAARGRRNVAAAAAALLPQVLPAAVRPAAQSAAGVAMGGTPGCSTPVAPAARGSMCEGPAAGSEAAAAHTAGVADPRGDGEPASAGMPQPLPAGCQAPKLLSAPPGLTSQAPSGLTPQAPPARHTQQPYAAPPPPSPMAAPPVSPAALAPARPLGTCMDGFSARTMHGSPLPPRLPSSPRLPLPPPPPPR
eukprot:331392-Chlamydomonas_euryale.AAC.1